MKVILESDDNGMPPLPELVRIIKILTATQFDADDRKRGSRVFVKGRAGGVMIQASTVNRDSLSVERLIKTAIDENPDKLTVTFHYAANP